MSLAWLTVSSLLLLSAGGSPRSVVVLGVSLAEAPVDDATGVVQARRCEADPKTFTLGLLLDTATAEPLSLSFTARNDAYDEREGLRSLRMDVVQDRESNGFSGQSWRRSR